MLPRLHLATILVFVIGIFFIANLNVNAAPGTSSAASGGSPSGSAPSVSTAPSAGSVSASGGGSAASEIPKKNGAIVYGRGLFLTDTTVEASGGRTAEITAGRTLALQSGDCGSYIGGDGMGVSSVQLPSAPVAGCEFTFHPALYDMRISTNGLAMYLPGYGAHPITEMTLSPYDLGSENYFGIVFDGTQWEARDHAGALYENLMPLDSPRLAHGQVRFAYDADSGSFGLCPQNGPGGLIVRNLMHRIPQGCLTTGRINTTSAAINYFYVAQDLAAPVTGAANNGAGLIRLTLANSASPGDRVNLICYSIEGTVEANGTWTGTVVDSSHVDLAGSTYANAFASSPYARCRIDRLMAATIGHHTAQNGVETQSTNDDNTFVGMAYVGAGNAVNDSPTKRDVASWFNRTPETCQNAFTADRSTTSLSYTELNPEIECEFVSFGGADLPWSISGMVANTKPSGGSAVSVGFDGATPEQDETAFVNGTDGGVGNMLSLSGMKSGLPEGKHYITLLAKSISLGKTSVFGSVPKTSLKITLTQ